MAESTTTTTTTTTTKPNDLPAIRRFITDHDPATGRAVFSTRLPEALPGRQVMGDGVVFSLGYATRPPAPVDLSGGRDITDGYAPLLETPPGIVVPGGTVVRFVDMPPGALSPMHRTVSLDYGVVLEGEVDLVLDGGEERAMRRGDLAVQRATMHAWRNRSATAWARMMYVLQEARPVRTAAGEVLGEDYGEMAGHVPESSKGASG